MSQEEAGGEPDKTAAQPYSDRGHEACRWRAAAWFCGHSVPRRHPRLSPKGTTAVWDDEQLVFTDIRSPGTVGNLRAKPAVEVNVVDPITRKGYLF
jgi:hypothetical protein